MRALGLVLAVAILAPVAVQPAQPAAPSANVLDPVSSGGLETVDLALRKLDNHRRLLIIGAHPDDEDNALLTWVGRGLAGEAAYLSLSRGEGGQNLIGTELGVELGILRSGELVAARRIEGTRQYFARAYDFGYTRSLTEAFERWPREVLLEDAMRAVRRFKPQAIVSVFPADERAGHGQHQAAGVIAREVFTAAREGRAFSALDDEGLEPWAPAVLYQRAWSREQATAGFDLGTLEPVGGRTLAQVAAESRSQHRSQDMGRKQPLGRWIGGVAWLAGVGEGADELFGGLDTRLTAVADLLEDRTAKELLSEQLETVAALAKKTRSELAPGGLGEAVEPLAEIVRRLDEALATIPPDSPARGVVVELLGEKRDLAARALTAAAGLFVDAVADRELAVPGGKLDVRVESWSPGAEPILTHKPHLTGPLVSPQLEIAPYAEDVSERTGVSTWRFNVEVASEQPPTIPYYLRRARQGDLYDWTAATVGERGEPWSTAPLVAWLDVEIAGVSVPVVREVVYRYGDQAIGEVRRPLRVVPTVELELEPPLVLWNRRGAVPRDLRVIARSNSKESIAAELALAMPGGWSVGVDDDEISFTLDPTRREAAITLPLTPPDSVAVGRYEFEAQLFVDDSEIEGLSVPTLDYPHIEPVTTPRPARVSVSVFDLELPDVERIGYVVGASDRVPGVLAALGLPVEVLDEETLATEDLSVYDAIVVGSRAYEIDSALAAANSRLLDYGRAGGTLIVQYQQYQFVGGGFAPYTLTIGRPHGRVTDETAPVEILEPEHPLFTHPNQLGAGDWEGWVQERGLYFSDLWDESYRPLLSLSDPGRDAERGGLLVAPLGRGIYVYTGLSFFRQLPAGVPGAMRLFANLLALEGAG